MHKLPNLGPSVPVTEYTRAYSVLLRHGEDRCELTASTQRSGEKLPLLRLSGVQCPVRTEGRGYVTEMDSGLDWMRTLNRAATFAGSEPFPGFEKSEVLRPRVEDGHVVYAFERIASMDTVAPDMLKVIGDTVLRDTVHHVEPTARLAKDSPEAQNILPSIALLQLGGDLPVDVVAEMRRDI